MGRKAEVQRMLLEKIMGPEAMGTAQSNLHFTDPKVCRNFLCAVCPHELFSNTKVDLGPCPRSHMAKLRDEYKAALDRGERYPQFELEYDQNIRTFIADIDRKINANKRRLEQTPEEMAKFSNLMREISEIETAEQAAMAEVERLGEAGEVDASLAELAKAEALKEEKAGKQKELQNLNENSGASGHQKLRVCDVCGAYLSILDSDRRLADHFGGKMHLGYLKLRQLISENEEKRAKGEFAQPGSVPPQQPPPSSSSTSSYSQYPGPRGAATGFGAPPANGFRPMAGGPFHSIPGAGGGGGGGGPGGMGAPTNGFRPMQGGGMMPPPSSNGSYGGGSGSGGDYRSGRGGPPMGPAGVGGGAGYDRERDFDRERDRRDRDRRESRDHRDRNYDDDRRYRSSGRGY
ncbi:splicing factor [Tilletia horrida]|nr:splicing factor [Tilletia horrida]